MTDFEAALSLIRAELETTVVVEHLIGERFKAQHSGPARVVWVPRRGRFKEPRQGGSAIVGSVRQRVIMARHEIVEAHIYADSDSNVEILFLDVVAAVHRALGSSADLLTEGEYFFETNDPPGADRSQPHDSHMRWLSKIMLSFPIRYSVTGEISALTTIEAFETTDKLNETVDVVIEQTAG